jgi:hypothetical protein
MERCRDGLEQFFAALVFFVVSYISGFPQLGQSLRGGAKRLVFFADGKARQISTQLFV